MELYKKLVFFLITLFVCLFVSDKVYAEELSITDNDYQLVCTYKDGSVLTITRDEVYFSNNSISVNSNSTSGVKFYIASDQENAYQSITDEGKCPTKLYAYYLSAKYDESISSDSNDVVTLYYSTKDGIEDQVGGTRGCGFLWSEECNNATQDTSLTTTLVSEEVYLTTSKATTVCDYEASSDSAGTSSQVASVYLFDNLTVVETNGYTSFLDGEPWNVCQGTGDTSKIYINDPEGKTVANGVGTSYYYKRFKITYGDNSTTIANAKSTCSNTYNNGKSCTAYEYIGYRVGDASVLTENEGVCEVLGSETITQIKNIISILQILVPLLVIVLTGIDLGKLVLSGDLEEELPKKKKTIVVRFVIMMLFFFLPLITNLILDQLEEAGVIGVESIECITDDV